MTQDEAAIADGELDQIVDRGPGQCVHQPVGIVVAAHQMFPPRQGSEGRLRGHAPRVVLASREIADDPQVVFGADHSGTAIIAASIAADEAKGRSKNRRTGSSAKWVSAVKKWAMREPLDWGARPISRYGAGRKSPRFLRHVRK